MTGDPVRKYGTNHQDAFQTAKDLLDRFPERIENMEKQGSLAVFQHPDDPQVDFHNFGVPKLLRAPWWSTISQSAFSDMLEKCISKVLWLPLGAEFPRPNIPHPRRGFRR